MDKLNNKKSLSDGTASGASDEIPDSLPTPSPDGEAVADKTAILPPDTAGSPEPTGSAEPKKFFDYIHPVSLALFVVALIAGGVLFVSYRSIAFSDYFNRNISSVFRFTLAKITDLLPFSLAETIVFCLPIFIVLAIIHAVKLTKKSAAKNCRYIMALLSVLSLLFSLFVLNFATAYRGSTLEVKLGLDRENVSADQLKATAQALLDHLDSLIGDVQFNYGSSSVMPYSLSEMNTKLNDAYAKASEKYSFIQSMRTNVKSIVLSEPMTYTHISGVYSYFTGEANLNTNFPDFMLPYTAAHELSHQRGIAREDEANFMAFLVCIESDDPYILYSGYFNLLSYVLSSLSTADPAAYTELWNNMDRRLCYEFIAYSSFFDKYRESKVSEISEAVNDTFLKSQGQVEGTRSYGRVTDLAVAYAVKYYGVSADTTQTADTAVTTETAENTDTTGVNNDN
jgi:hypothetical protein